jgi:3-hydroxyisobutyrate dehydrogenase
MAGNVIACGEAGAGIAAKLVNNMMLFISVMADVGGLAARGAARSGSAGVLGRRARLVGDSWALRTWYPVPGIVEKAAANKNFDATFSVDLARKDCGLAVQAGDDTGVHLPAARLALGQLDDLIAEGLGGKDCTVARSPRRTAPSAATTRRVTASPRPDPHLPHTPIERALMTTASASPPPTSPSARSR